MTESITTPTVAAPDVVRCAYMELVVTDLQKSRDFYVDVLDLQVTWEDENTVYLRSMEEFIHHNLVRRGRVLVPGPHPRGRRCRRGVLP